jgi:hypothetical protein|tara:strand:- start:2525 stop:3160 length:636 start_codon:yes stop_codon:yes gene_type:complete
MNAKKIALILIPLNILLVYFVYNSIDSEVVFNKEAKLRIAENVQKLKDLRTLQIAFKKEKSEFASDFNSLIDFLNNDSITIIKSEGETPDTIIKGVQLTDERALELGLIKRDTFFIAANESIFDDNYLNSRNNQFPLDLINISKVPFTELDYNIDAGEIEKGKVAVQVFEISATYDDVLTGLDAENKKYVLDNLLKVGSMTEASLNGNWGE